MEEKVLLNDDELDNVVGGIAEEEEKDHKLKELDMIDELSKNSQPNIKDEMLKSIEEKILGSTNKKKGV